MFWVEWDLKGHLVPTPQCWAEMPLVDQVAQSCIQHGFRPSSYRTRGIRHKQNFRKFHLNIDQSLAQVAQRCGGVSIPGDIQKSNGHNSGQPALAHPALSRIGELNELLICRPTKMILSNDVILCSKSCLLSLINLKQCCSSEFYFILSSSFGYLSR